MTIDYPNYVIYAVTHHCSPPSSTHMYTHACTHTHRHTHSCTHTPYTVLTSLPDSSCDSRQKWSAAYLTDGALDAWTSAKTGDWRSKHHLYTRHGLRANWHTSCLQEHSQSQDQFLCNCPHGADVEPCQLWTSGLC